MKRKTGKTILMCVGLFFCTCSDLTNPFQNKGEARAEITNWNLSDSVSINIFSTYSIPVRVLLGEHLDSFKVHIDNNRLWSSQDSVVFRNEIRPGRIYSFPFSFYDTGWQKIKITSYRNNGDSIADSCILRAVSPLKQNPISGVVGDSILLNTLPIKDKQVLYIWDFHNGVVIKEYACSVLVKITAPFTSRYGQLYVEDYSGRRSPVTLFEITSQSPQKELSLACINDSIRGDTVLSADAQMKFRLEVSGAQQLKNASVNGQKFDESQRRGDLFLLGYNLKGIDTATTPQKLNVSITDDLGRSISRTFYVKFIKITPVIYVAYPEDSLHTAATSVNVLGSVSNIRQNSLLYLFARNNGKELAKALVTNSQPVFSFEIPLSGTSNHISLELFSDSLMNGFMLAKQDFYVIYDPSHVDTTAPQIRNIRCNGTLVDSVFTSRTDMMHLEIDAVDNSNKLIVTVNGQPVVKGSDELFYSTEVILTHKKERTEIAIQAKDSAGYLVEDTIYVWYNRLPKWDDIPSYTVVNADENNLFKISIIDPDGDPVLVTMNIPLKSGDTVMNASSGQVYWKPQIADTGIYDVRLEVSDEYEITDTFFTVLVKGKGATSVQLLTSENDFPDTLWIGGTLSVPLKAIPLTGTRPFTYEANFIDSKSANILHRGSDSVLHWIPKLGDTGLRKLCAKITDSLGYADSITVEIMVLLATAQWEKNPVQCYEKDSMLTTRAILSKPLTFPVSIGYRITFPYNPGASEKDFNASLSGAIKFNEGDTVSSLKIKIIDDSIPEFTEKFNIELLDNDSLRSDFPILECEIIDNDLVFFNFEINETDHRERDRTDTLLVKISKPLEMRLVLSCLVDSSSTAKLGEDFTLEDSEGTVVFEPGETEALVILNILDDTIPEKDEKIVLELKSDSSFAAAKIDLLDGSLGNTFTYTIINDDGDPIKYYFTQKEMEGKEGDTEIKIAVKLSKIPPLPFTVEYKLDKDITKTNAVLNSDFRFMDNTGLLTFAAGDTIEEISILLIDDTIPNDDAFFTLNLHSESEFVEPGKDTSIQYTIRSNEIEVYIKGQFSTVNEYSTDHSINIDFALSSRLQSELKVYFEADDSSTAIVGKNYEVNGPDYLVFKPGDNEESMFYNIFHDKESTEDKHLIFRIVDLSDKKIAYIGQNSWVHITIQDIDNWSWMNKE